MFPNLETRRFRLTRINSEDVTAIFQLFSDPRVVEFYDLEPFTSLSDAESLMAVFESRFALRSGIRWAIRERGTAELVGTCGFNTWSTKMRNGTIGYDLKPASWGSGVATEAVSEILRAALSGELPCGQLHRVQADTIVGNKASERVLEKLGFKEEGIRRHAAYIHGSFRDMKCFGLVAGAAQ